MFRDQLYKYFENVQPEDWNGYLTALDKAGNSLDYRKYADQLLSLIHI